MTIENNLIFVVRHVAVDYRAPARLDDLLTISCAVHSIRPTRVLFSQSANRANDGISLVNAEVEVVAVSRDTLKPRVLPATLLNILQQTIGTIDV